MRDDHRNTLTNNSSEPPNLADLDLSNAADPDRQTYSFSRITKRGRTYHMSPIRSIFSL